MRVYVIKNDDCLSKSLNNDFLNWSKQDIVVLECV